MSKKILFYTFMFMAILFTSYYLIKTSSDKKSITLYATLATEKNEITRNISPPDLAVEDKHSYDFVPNAHIEFITRNSDYMGWLIIEDTNINYPVVRGKDNTHYLTHDFDNNTNQIGSIFMDYRNIGHFNDWQTVIYGHYVKAGQMFHDLHLYKDYDFYTSHNTLTFTSLYDKKTFKVFSVYTIIADNDVIILDIDENDRSKHLMSLQEKSMHPNDEGIDPSLKIITLVTCTYEEDNARIILHAYEIP